MTTFTKQVLRVSAAILVVNTLGVWGMLVIDHQRLSKLEAFEQNARLLQKEKAVESNANKFQDQPVESSKDANNDLESRIETLESSVSALQKKTTSQTVKYTTSPQSASAQKEYIVYLGTGSTNKREWTTLDNAFVELNSSNYQHISTVYYEAGLSVIGGEVYTRLIDVSNGSIVSPELMHNTQTVTWKSTQFSLSSGSHKYAVQLKSSSGDDVFLSGARIRIIAD